MNIEVSDWVSIAAFATSFIAFLEARKSSRSKDAIHGLKDIYEASEKTQIYLAARGSGKDRDIETEIVIRHLWSKAAATVSKVDEALSIRLNRKSEFWQNPEIWRESLRANIDVSLESVTRDAKKLLGAYA